MKKGIQVKQRDVSDCGAACLASVAAYFGLQIPVSRIRQYAGTDKQGTSLHGLIEAAEQFEFSGQGRESNRHCFIRYSGSDHFSSGFRKRIAAFCCCL